MDIILSYIENRQQQINPHTYNIPMNHSDYNKNLNTIKYKPQKKVYNPTQHDINEIPLKTKIPSIHKILNKTKNT